MKWKFLPLAISLLLFLIPSSLADITTWRTGESNDPRIVFKITDYDTILKFQYDISISQLGWHTDKIVFYDIEMNEASEISTFTISVIQGNLSITKLMEEYIPSRYVLEATGSADSGNQTEFYLIVTDLWSGIGEPSRVVINGTAVEKSGSYAEYDIASGNYWCYSDSKVYVKGLASSNVTYSLEWEEEEGGDGDGVTPPPIVSLKSSSIDVGKIEAGSSETFDAILVWSGPSSVVLSNVEFYGRGSEWTKHELTLPLTSERSPLETETKIYVPVMISPSPNAEIDKYKMNIIFQIDVGMSKFETANTIDFEVSPTTGGLPDVISAVLLIGLVASTLSFIFYKR